MRFKAGSCFLVDNLLGTCFDPVDDPPQADAVYVGDGKAFLKRDTAFDHQVRRFGAGFPSSFRGSRHLLAYAVRTLYALRVFESMKRAFGHAERLLRVLAEHGSVRDFSKDGLHVFLFHARSVIAVVLDCKFVHGISGHVWLFFFML